MGRRVVVAGATGLIGGALGRHLLGRGDTVVRLVRRPIRAADEVRWDPAAGALDPTAFEGVDAVVNLAGVGVGDKRWTDEHKRAVESSRVDTTATIARAIVDHLDRTGNRVRFVNGSAVGFYGDRGEELLSESSAAGTDFLSGVVTRWEQAADPARQVGIEVSVVRSGIVMSRTGGAFAPLLRMARLGLGGPLGSGQEWWPWITLVDEVRAIAHLIDRREVTGPVNLTAPGAARQKDIARQLGRALSRPSIVPAPRIALRVVVGEFADSILVSQHVEPEVLLADGFRFEHPDLASAVSWLTAR